MVPNCATHHICGTENIVNTRPLTYLSEENFDEPITPYHLIYTWKKFSEYKSFCYYENHER